MNTKQGKLPNKPRAAAIATDSIGTGVMHLAVLLWSVHEHLGRASKSIPTSARLLPAQRTPSDLLAETDLDKLYLLIDMKCTSSQCKQAHSKQAKARFHISMPCNIMPCSWTQPDSFQRKCPRPLEWCLLAIEHLHNKQEVRNCYACMFATNINQPNALHLHDRYPRAAKPKNSCNFTKTWAHAGTKDSNKPKDHRRSSLCLIGTKMNQKEDFLKNTRS